MQRVEDDVGADLAHRVDEAGVEVERLRVVPEVASARITAPALDRDLALGARATHDDRDPLGYLLDIRYELSDEVDFEVEIDAERVVDRAVNAGEQRADVERASRRRR